MSKLSFEKRAEIVAHYLNSSERYAKTAKFSRKVGTFRHNSMTGFLFSPRLLSYGEFATQTNGPVKHRTKALL